jgi:hypothetical protein
MKEDDPLATWRSNPFFVLGIGIEASRIEVERAGQRLLGLLAIGSESARCYHTPFGPAMRDEDSVRQAMAQLRDPGERVVHELLADVAPSALRAEARATSEAEARAFPGIGKWAR